MPADVEIFEFDFDGKMTPKPEWTRSAAQNVDAVVKSMVEANGGDTFGPEDLGAVEPPYIAFKNWSRSTLLQIALVLNGDRPTNRHSVSEWRFPWELGAWRAALDSDFVLMVVFRDAHETVGRALANIVAQGADRAAQTGIACVVDLRDGRIVWCEHNKAPSGDLRSLHGATDPVHYLLRGVLGPPSVRQPPPARRY